MEPDSSLAAVARPVWQGQQAVSGLWLPDYLPVTQRQQIVLAQWQPHARLLSHQAGWLLIWSQAQHRDVAQLPGWPLVKLGQVLSSAPLSPSEQPATTTNLLWLILGAQVVRYDMTDFIPIQPHHWLGDSRFHIASSWKPYELYDDSPIVAPSTVAPRSVSSVLAHYPDTDLPARQQFLKSRLQAIHESNHEATHSTTSSKPLWLKLLLLPINLVLFLLLYLIDRIFFRRNQADLDQQTTELAPKTPSRSWFKVAIGVFLFIVGLSFLIQQISQHSASGSSSLIFALIIGLMLLLWVLRQTATQASAVELSGRRHPLSFLYRWLFRTLNYLSFGRADEQELSRQQRAYLEKMLKLFEQEQWQEALRHGISLSHDQNDLSQTYPETGALAPTSTLSFEQHHGTTALYLPETVQRRIEQTYEQAVERLIALDRIDEAVYILGCLLHRQEDALDLLERNQRYQQAAELALLWEMNPHIVVRYLILAQDIPRAIEVAERSHSYGIALTLLSEDEAENPELTPVILLLREKYAIWLVQKGQWSSALNSLTPYPKLHDLAARLLREQLASSSDYAHFEGLYLYWQLALAPHSLPSAQKQLERLQAPDAYLARSQFAAQFLKTHGYWRKEALACWLAALLPHLLADYLAHRTTLSKVNINLLAECHNEAILGASWPKSVTWESVTPSQVSHPATLEAPPGGLFPIYDACLITLEETNIHWIATAQSQHGLALYDANGALIRRVSEPVDYLIRNPEGTSLLLIKQQAERCRVVHYDWLTGAIRLLGSIRLASWSASFDGIGWSVVTPQGQHHLIDTRQSLQHIAWQETIPFDQRVIYQFCHDNSEYLLLQKDGHLSIREYHLPWRRRYETYLVPKPNLKTAIEQQVNVLLYHTTLFYVSLAVNDDQLTLNINRLYYYVSHSLIGYTINVALDASLKGMNWTIRPIALYGESYYAALIGTQRINATHCRIQLRIVDLMVDTANLVINWPYLLCNSGEMSSLVHITLSNNHLIYTDRQGGVGWYNLDIQEHGQFSAVN